MIRLRTIQQCMAEIIKLDPDTAISEWFIRSLCKSNKIQYILSGNKSLVNKANYLLYFIVAVKTHLQKNISFM